MQSFQEIKFYFMYTSFERKFTELNMFLKIYRNAVYQEYSFLNILRGQV